MTLVRLIAQLSLDPPDNLTVIYVAATVVIVLGGGFISLLVLFARARGWVKEMIDEAQGPMLAELRDLRTEFHELNDSLRTISKEIQKILLDNARSDGRVDQLRSELTDTRQSLRKLRERVTAVEHVR